MSEKVGLYLRDLLQAVRGELFVPSLGHNAAA